MSIINCKFCMSPKTCDCICSTCLAAKCVMSNAGKVDRTHYLALRRLGLRASSAFIIAKYGFDGLISLLIDEDILGV